jgi:hypothetical protein
VYAGTKGAVDTIAKTMAKEFDAKKIRVNGSPLREVKEFHRDQYYATLDLPVDFNAERTVR